ECRGIYTIHSIKKTVEIISFDRRRGLESGPNAEESWERASLSVILGAEMHKQPIPPLKQVDNEEDDVKTENTKDILPLILDGITTAKEPTTNINEELELEEEKKWLKLWKELFRKEKNLFTQNFIK
ncbi:hypothetical protein CWI36_1444p0010, partial [Hamiltosporidium magnivora]